MTGRSPLPGSGVSLRSAPFEPFGNMRFRVEIAGVESSGAREVIFPEARVRPDPRESGAAFYGPLIVRRGVTRSTEWSDWWQQALQAHDRAARHVAVILLDAQGRDVRRWVFPDSTPAAYTLSNLDALGSQVLVESLEMAVGGFSAATMP